jgi:hypothetical protein
LLSGPRRNPSAGSNPALSAEFLVSFSLVQIAATSPLPTGCPKSSRPIASRSALGARCMYLSVMVNVLCPARSWIAFGAAPRIVRFEQKACLSACDPMRLSPAGCRHT